MSTFSTPQSGLTGYDRGRRAPQGIHYHRGGTTMPYEIRRAGGSVCVFKAGANEPLHCYAGDDAEEKAAAYLQALYAHEPGRKQDGDGELVVVLGGAVKALPGGRIRGRLVPFGTPDELDLDGEFFDAATDYDREFPTKISTYYDHGFDETLGKRRLTRAKADLADDGIWLEDQLDLSDRYQAKIYALAAAGRLHLSSGSITHLVEKEPAGKGVRISRWPLGEASYTVKPANPNAKVETVKSWLEDRTTFAAAVEALPAGRASLAENTEQWLDRGEDVLAQFQRLGQAEVKVGRPQFSAARVERMQRMFLLLQDLLHECGGMPPETEPTPAPGRGATAADGAALEGQFLATVARLNGVAVDAPTPAASAAGA